MSYFTAFFSVSIVDFEQVFVCWNKKNTTQTSSSNYHEVTFLREKFGPCCKTFHPGHKTYMEHT